MKPYFKLYKNNASVSMKKLFPSGYYEVKLLKPNGDRYDRVLCDDYRDALAYRKCFGTTAKSL